MFNVLTTLLLLLAASADARELHSRDAHVRDVMAACERNVSVSKPVIGEDTCLSTLECILNGVDSATQGRWSAGASILAFISAIAALVSNSIDDAVLILEESRVLALVLSLCSFTVLSPRFGGERNPRESTAAVKEELKRCVMRAYEESDPAPRKRQLRWLYHAVLGVVLALLVASLVLIWCPAVEILRNGVVVFSCHPWVHIPICESN